jgi:hypothetical protein
MKNRLIMLLFLISAIIIIISCSSSDSTTPTTNFTRILPNTAGSYWINSNTILDTTGPRDGVYLDSVYYAGNETILGNDAGKYIENFQGDSVLIKHLFEDKTGIWAYSDVVSSLTSIEDVSSNIKIASKVPDAWYLLIDKSNNNWNVAEFKIDTAKYNSSIITGTIKITAARGNTEIDTVNSALITCQLYNYTVTFSGTMSNTSNVYTIDYSRNVTIAFADGVGFVKIIKEAKAAEVPLIGLSFNILGFEKDLIRYNIGK